MFVFAQILFLLFILFYYYYFELSSNLFCIIPYSRMMAPLLYIYLIHVLFFFKYGSSISISRAFLCVSLLLSLLSSFSHVMYRITSLYGVRSPSHFLSIWCFLILIALVCSGVEPRFLRRIFGALVMHLFSAFPPFHLFYLSIQNYRRTVDL